MVYVLNKIHKSMPCKHHVADYFKQRESETSEEEMLVINKGFVFITGGFN